MEDGAAAAEAQPSLARWEGEAGAAAEAPPSPASQKKTFEFQLGSDLLESAVKKKKRKCNPRTSEVVTGKKRRSHDLTWDENYKRITEITKESGHFCMTQLPLELKKWINYQRGKYTKKGDDFDPDHKQKLDYLCPSILTGTTCSICFVAARSLSPYYK